MTLYTTIVLVGALVACCYGFPDTRVGVITYTTAYVSGTGSDDTLDCLEATPCATLEYAFENFRNAMVGDLTHQGLEFILMGPGGEEGSLGDTYLSIGRNSDVNMIIRGVIDSSKSWDTYTYRLGANRSTRYIADATMASEDDYRPLELEFRDLTLVTPDCSLTMYGIYTDDIPGNQNRVTLSNVEVFGTRKPILQLHNTLLIMEKVSFRPMILSQNGCSARNDIESVIDLNGSCEVVGTSIGVYGLEGGGDFFTQNEDYASISLEDVAFQDCEMSLLSSKKRGLTVDIKGLVASNSFSSFLVEATGYAILEFHDTTIYGSDNSVVFALDSGSSLDITNMTVEMWKGGTMFEATGNSVVDVSNLYLSQLNESGKYLFNTLGAASVFLRNSVIQGTMRNVVRAQTNSKVFIENCVFRDLVFKDFSRDAPTDMLLITSPSSSYSGTVKISNSVITRVTGETIFWATPSIAFRFEVSDITIADIGSTMLANDVEIIVSGPIHLCNVADQTTNYTIENSIETSDPFYSDTFTEATHIHQTAECPCSELSTCASCKAANEAFPARTLCGFDHYSNKCLIGETIDSASEIKYPTYPYAPGQRRFPDPDVGKPMADQWTWPPAECGIADSTGGACVTHTDCDSCGSDSLCGWCATTQRCMAGDVTGPAVAGSCPLPYPSCVEGETQSIYCPKSPAWGFAGCDAQCAHAGYVHDGCGALDGASGHLKLVKDVTYSWTPVESATTIAPIKPQGSSAIGPFTIPFHFQPTDDVWPHFYLSEHGFISLERDSRSFSDISTFSFETEERSDFLAFFFADGHLFGDESSMRVMTGGVAPYRWLVVEFEGFEYDNIQTSASVQLKISEDPQLPISVHVKTFDSNDLVGQEIVERASFNVVTIGFYESSASGGLTSKNALFQSLPVPFGERDNLSIPGEYAVGFSRCGMQSSLTEFKTADSCKEIHPLCGTLHLGKCKKCLTGYC